MLFGVLNLNNDYFSSFKTQSLYFDSRKSLFSETIFENSVSLFSSLKNCSNTWCGFSGPHPTLSLCTSQKHSSFKVSHQYDTKKTNNGSGGQNLNCSTNFVACHPLRDLCTFLICFFFQLNIVLAFKRFVEKLELLFLCFLCFSLQV